MKHKSLERHNEPDLSQTVRESLQGGSNLFRDSLTASYSKPPQAVRAAMRAATKVASAFDIETVQDSNRYNLTSAYPADF